MSAPPTSARGASSLALVALLFVALGASARVEAQAGWRELDLGGGHRAVRFLPSSVRTCDPSPLLVFLHGAGGTPEAYEPHLDVHAESLGLVLLLPASTSAGWSGADAAVINDALDALAAELLVDDTRTYLGGHSAGGAFSYLLAYDSTGIAAVFSMSAPFYAVSALGEPSYPAPIRMYYGDRDPNYSGGSATALAAQWDRLGVPHETDVQAGYEHSTWPASSIHDGLAFLLAHRHPGTAPSSRCGDPDAGASARDASVVAIDAGVAAGDGGARDAAIAEIDGTATDARATNVDAGRSRPIASGCSCRAGANPRMPWFLGLVALVAQRLRVRRAGASPRR